MSLLDNDQLMMIYAEFIQLFYVEIVLTTLLICLPEMILQSHPLNFHSHLMMMPFFILKLQSKAAHLLKIFYKANNNILLKK